MAEKYKVDLDLPGNEKKTSESGEQQYLTVQQAGFIPRSVRMEITEKGVLPDAPTKTLVQACILLADISGFTALGEKLTAEHGDVLTLTARNEYVLTALDHSFVLSLTSKCCFESLAK